MTTTITTPGTTGTPSTPGTTGASARWREKYDHLFEAFWEHPFLAGLRDGTLAPEKVLHYVGQDHQYLTAFMRCYGLGAAASPDRDWIGFFTDQTNFLLHDETHPHHVMCDAVGVSYAEAQVERLAPSAQAYVNHMMAAAHDSLGVLMAALLPCPWTYIWAGTRLLAEAPPGPDNPFAGWWEFYGSPDCQGLLDEFCRRLDLLAAEAGPAELARMEAAFELSCHHETRFWQMAWSRETW
ncbi:thiaminase II [Microlunatus sp. Y2014]|uniref:thiaminase II n=1 Tax=Microlunatus sp. Y2014 TaxID=3418488 RepID=UPI003DA77C9B